MSESAVGPVTSNFAVFDNGRMLSVFFNNVSEVDDSTPGEIGVYVVSRSGGPVAAEIVFGSARQDGAAIR